MDLDENRVVFGLLMSLSDLYGVLGNVDESSYCSEFLELLFKIDVKLDVRVNLCLISL